MGFGTVIAYYLTDLHTLHGPDKPAAEDDNDQKGGHRCKNGAESDISKNVKADKNRVQRIEQMVEHYSALTF